MNNGGVWTDQCMCIQRSMSLNMYLREGLVYMAGTVEKLMRSSLSAVPMYVGEGYGVTIISKSNLREPGLSLLMMSQNNTFFFFYWFLLFLHVSVSWGFSQINRAFLIQELLRLVRADLIQKDHKCHNYCARMKNPESLLWFLMLDNLTGLYCGLDYNTIQCEYFVLERLS